MVTIYYDSKTGNVERFIQKIEAATDWNIKKIDENTEVTERGHLITFTTRFGEIPDQTLKFLNRASEWLDSVSSSGNRNWGRNFGMAGDAIQQEYGIPLLFKFELSGTSEDVTTFINLIQELNYGKERNSEKLDIAQQ